MNTTFFHKIFLSAGLLLAIITPSAKAQEWTGLEKGINGSVTAMLAYDSVLYISGGFDSAGGHGARYIAQWNGSSWSTLGKGLNGGAIGMAIYNRALYVVGYFDSAGTVKANSLACWNGSTWSAVGNVNFNNFVTSVTVYNGDLYVGGDFTSDGLMPFTGPLVMWNGSVWDTARGAVRGGHIDDLASFGNTLYVAGLGLTTMNLSQSQTNIAWNGSAWAPMGLNQEFNAALSYQGNFYVAGLFDSAGGQPANSIAEWNGSQWSALGAGVANAGAFSMAGYNGNIYAVFTDTVPWKYSVNISKWNGSSWNTLIGVGTNSSSSVILFNSTLYQGGGFSTVNGIPIKSIAVDSNKVF